MDLPIYKKGYKKFAKIEFLRGLRASEAMVNKAEDAQS